MRMGENLPEEGNGDTGWRGWGAVFPPCLVQICRAGSIINVICSFLKLKIQLFNSLGVDKYEKN
jgi:hypothetical protein